MENQNQRDHLDLYEKNQKDHLSQWMKEHECYVQMIHQECIELSETKLITEKLKEQVRTISLMVKKEEARQEQIAQEIH